MLDALKNKIAAARTQVLDHLKVSNDVRQHRFDICKSCDNLTSSEFCKVCSCYMPAKTWIPSASCPIKKWIPLKNAVINNQ